MHELSIATGIVKIAESELKRSEASSIKKIELEIGTLAGVEFEALDFVWPLAVKDTVLERSDRVIHKIPAQACCLECDHIYFLPNLYTACPECNSYLKGILKGRELRVLALEVE